MRADISHRCEQSMLGSEFRSEREFDTIRYTRYLRTLPLDPRTSTATSTNFERCERASGKHQRPFSYGGRQPRLTVNHA